MRGYWLNPEHESSKVVRELGDLEFRGNIVPHQWCRSLIAEATRSPLLTDIMILSEIVYWYRPIVIPEEGNGNVVFRKKFKGDLLQLKKRRFCSKFGFSMGRVDRSLKYLEAEGIIFRELRTITQTDGGRLHNVQYIGINFERLAAITNPQGDDETQALSSVMGLDVGADDDSLTPSTTMGVTANTDSLSTSASMGMGVGRDTNTKTTTKTTSKTTAKKEDIYSLPPLLSDSYEKHGSSVSIGQNELTTPDTHPLSDPTRHQAMVPTEPSSCMIIQSG